MALFKTKGTGIQGIITVVPSEIEDNLALEGYPAEMTQKLVQHTGIRYRRRAAPNSLVKDYFQKAIEHLLQKLNWAADSIDILICVTQSADSAMPSLACKLQGDLSFSNNTFCYDINSGCSGFVYGLHTVNSLLSNLSTQNGRAILCCGDLSSILTEGKDQTVRPIFSDAVAAIGIEKSESYSDSVSYFNLQTFGKGQEAIQMEKTDQGHFMRLKGLDVFNYSVKYAPPNIMELLNFSNLETTDIQLFVMHQANQLINESIRKQLKISSDICPSSLADFGNTAIASIPLTLGLYFSEHAADYRLLISGFGVGFSVGSAIIDFHPSVCLPPISF